MGIRLTKAVRQALLDSNDGFTASSHYEGKNFRESREYRIENGELHVHSKGKTSWADSYFDDEWVADDEETHRFLSRYKDELSHE